MALSGREGFGLMKRRLPKFVRAAIAACAVFALAWISFSLSGCSSSHSTLTCGGGTVQKGNVCVAETTLPDASTNQTPEAGPSDGALTALPPVFGGITGLAPVSTSALLAVWNPGVDANTPGATLSYRIYVAPVGTPIDYTTPTQYTAPGATSAVIGGLAANTAYAVGVRAVGSLNVEDTNTLTQTATPVADTTAPTFAGLVSAAPGGSGEIVLSWAPASDDLSPASAISYLVFMSLTGHGEDVTNPVLVTAPGATSAVIAHLANATLPRFFLVFARDAAGNVASNTAEHWAVPAPDTSPPTFAGCTAAANVSAVTVAVAWEAATDDVSLPANIQYIVLASTTPGDISSFKPIATVTGETGVTVPALTPSTHYYFICRAQDEAGNQDQNAVEVSATTGANPTPPTFVSTLSIAAGSAPFTATISWNPPATDDSTATSAIVYDVYQSTVSQGEKTSGVPQWSSTPGASSIQLTGLMPDATLYFVVCARDADGNHACASTTADAGTQELTIMTLVSFSQNVEPIFTHDCGVVGCHVPGNPAGALVLAKGFAYNSLFNVPGFETTNLLLKPDAALPAGMTTPILTLDGGASAITIDYVTPGDFADSFLYIKTHVAAYNAFAAVVSGQVGVTMPAPATGTTLSQDDLDAIQKWITQGAANN